MVLALEPTLAGVSALLLGISGIITAVIALRKAKQEGDESCHKELKASREEAEGYAQRLHKLRIEHPELMDDDDGAASLWMLVSIGLFALATFMLMTALGLPSAGPPGPPGPIGPNGKNGTPGPVGPTATTVIVVPGTGSNTNTGSSGSTGASGSTGGTGSAGEAGATGSTGTPGEAGSSGAVGPPGPPGPVGAAGPQGQSGPQGTQGERGAPGPVQTSPVCPSGFSLEQVTLKEKNNTFLAAICIAQ